MADRPVGWMSVHGLTTMCLVWVNCTNGKILSCKQKTLVWYLHLVWYKKSESKGAETFWSSL